jgi:hypothetical protein
MHRELICTARLLFGAIAGAQAQAQAQAQDQSLPDPRLTPGAIATTDRAEICARGYARAHRSWAAKWLTLQRYGIPRTQSHSFEDDDLVPICLGGDNASPLNHWPEPLPQAERKDDLEWQLCRAVCAGRLSLTEAQAIFLSGRWHSLIGVASETRLRHDAP